jgi:hypothetical protein
MDAKLKSINQIKLLTATEALERLFDSIESPLVKSEVFKWFAFGMNGKGKTLQTLTPEQLGELMDKLPDLVLALYNYQKEIQKGGDK